MLNQAMKIDRWEYESPVDQSRRLVHKLREQGLDVCYKEIPGSVRRESLEFSAKFTD